MRKNKALLKRAASLFTAFVMLAGSATYAQEEQTSQEVLSQEMLSESSSELSEELVNGTDPEILELTSETITESIEEQTQEAESESTQEQTQEVESESTQEQTQEVESESTQEQTQETASESIEEQTQETVNENLPELVQESNSEDETTECSTDAFVDSTDEDMDSDIYEIGDEFVKTFSFDMIVDRNPIYLGMAGISTATGNYYDQLDATSKRIYNAIYEANKSSASTAKMKLNLTKIFENQKVTKGTNGKAVYSEETKQAIFAWLGSYVTPAYLALTYDHPELVWLSGAKYTIGYSVYTPWFEEGETSIITDLELAGSTFTITPTKDTGALTASNVNPLFDGTKSQIDAMLPANATTYDKVKAVHDKICSMVSYENSTQNIGNPYYQTPYSLYYDADGDGKIETVCAGYAKMMKLQCNKYGIPCVLVTGVTDSGEYHMWNYIQMENGVWYAVDATWDDQSTTMYDFFLVGSETYSSAAFGTKKFGNTHIPSGKWTTSADCVFLYPVFSQTAYAGQNTVTSKNGLLKDSDGVWRYYTNNQVDTSYTGFAASGSDQVYLINGVQNTSYSGLIYNGGNWYYVQKGVRNTAYSGLSVYNGSWYYVKGGTADWSYTGLAQYNGVWYYVRQGSVDWEYTGLCQYDTIWFYIKNGALDWNYTGLCQHSGVWYYITKGQVNWNYTGSCIYNGKSYYVEKGVLNWKYNSTAVYSSASYTADLMNVALSQYQAEEVTVDETNIYSADTEPESTQTEEQESHEAEELNETETFETEEQTQEQTEKSVSQTEVAVQEESTVQYSLLERIEEYLIKFITYIVKLAAAYIGITL
ncbi:MAG: transglutaminase domain-containing protein [Lachnospiraceae bacterium]|jgi:outer membrane biosynthesis protein TonB